MTSNSQNIFYYSSLIGYFYQYGIGCLINKTKAFEIFSNFIKDNQKVESNQFTLDQKNETNNFCNDDDIRKLNKIVLQYFYSLFLYKDIILYRKENYKLHIKNAKKGDSTSQYFIGDCYHLGKNIKKDINKAFEWYKKSSERGNISAMYELGHCYCYEHKDEKKAFEFYLKSAEGGDKYALCKVGDYYYYGRSILKDEIKAFEWYLKAAKKGHAYSQYLMANYYNYGLYIPINKEKGFYWNRKAAINGVLEAQYKLADYYFNNSLNKNESKAFKWYLILANKSNNNLKAIYLVAKCYRDGTGTNKNLFEARKWIKKYEFLSKDYKKPLITLKDFLNGSNLNAFELSKIR
ncbi:hypothetical protein C1645_838719 [Glomus cerebriforme]|uniref:HCP-like protein n=1 Tax=Glomus cerebriforme TaxID=658196 RepID=A0A397S7Z3_9GLOM|nr:hypothetical protein C1645_838719 [Glomus cerebriforme]